MLDELHIRALGVIEDATLLLAPGFTVVTGETGAGKTMLVTALQLLLGARADSDLVRRGAETALVEARLHPAPSTAGDWVDDGDDLVVARELRAEGGSRARINGRLAPVGALDEVLGPHVEVHAQHEHHRLARPDVQRALLDAYAGDPHARTLARYREAYGQWRGAQTQLEELRASVQERARELDRLRFEVAEIDGVAITEADADIDARLERLQHAEELRDGLARASAALGSDGAQDPVGTAVEALRRLPVGGYEALQERAEGIAAEIAELGRDLRDAVDLVDGDPDEVARLVERRRAVRGLLRKYGPELGDVADYRAASAARITELEQADQATDDLEASVAAMWEDVVAAGAALHDGRRAAGEALARAVEGHLADLAMPHARVEIRIEPVAPAAHGADRVTFLLAPNPGESMHPLATAASGGERSRVALAVEVALADVDDASVLVFDEVDAGVGGATAMAVGEKLARLAAGGRRQVLCVTHLAQLAAYADVHHVVEKGIRDGRTVTTTRQVGEGDRVVELSRMLGGDTTDAGRAHAQELLDEATRRRAS